MENLTLICRNTVLFAIGHHDRQFFAGRDQTSFMLAYLRKLLATIISTTLPLQWPTLYFKNCFFQ